MDTEGGDGSARYANRGKIFITPEFTLYFRAKLRTSHLAMKGETEITVEKAMISVGSGLNCTPGGRIVYYTACNEREAR